MTVDLSKAELALLDEALKGWASAPIRDGMGSTLLGVMLSSREERGERGEMQEKIQTEMVTAQNIARLRERQALMLRAKLYQAEAKDSEHQT
jgi:hypothetical protein